MTFVAAADMASKGDLGCLVVIIGSRYAGTP